MTEQELVIDLPVDGPAVRKPQLVKENLCSTLVGEKNTYNGNCWMNVNQIVPKKLVLKSDPPNDSI